VCQSTPSHDPLLDTTTSRAARIYDMWSKLSSALKPKSGDAPDSLSSPIAADFDSSHNPPPRSLREKHSNIFRQASSQATTQKDKEYNQRTGSISFRKRASHLLLNKTNDHNSISGFGTLRSNTPVNVANGMFFSLSAITLSKEGVGSGQDKTSMIGTFDDPS
jgi:hypothetical protein